MTQYHPNTDLLSEYTSGVLPESQSLCIATHLEFCGKCKSESDTMLRLGAALFTATDNSARMNPGAIDNVLQTIDLTEHLDSTNSSLTAKQAGANSAAVALEAYPSDFPRRIRKLMPDGYNCLHWKNLGSRLSVAKLDRLDPTREIALHRLQPGGVVSDHDHGGCEITVVLSGSFSDQEGQYHPGDFLIREPGQTHRPTASEDGPCICLSVCDAPVKFTGFFTRFLNPLVALQHRH